MATKRQSPTQCIVRDNDLGTETALSTLGVTQYADKRIAIRLAENVVQELTGNVEILMITDRGTCWHRFHGAT